MNASVYITYRMYDGVQILGIIYAMKKIRVQQTWNVIGLNGLSTWVTNVSAHIGLHVFFFSKV